MSQPGPLSCPFFNEAGPDGTANAKGRVAMTVQMVEAKIKREPLTVIGRTGCSERRRADHLSIKEPMMRVFVAA